MYLYLFVVAGSASSFLSLRLDSWPINQKKVCSNMRRSSRCYNCYWLVPTHSVFPYCGAINHIWLCLDCGKKNVPYIHVSGHGPSSLTPCHISGSSVKHKGLTWNQLHPLSVVAGVGPTMLLPLSHFWPINHKLMCYVMQTAFRFHNHWMASLINSETRKVGGGRSWQSRLILWHPQIICNKTKTLKLGLHDRSAIVQC